MIGVANNTGFRKKGTFKTLFYLLFISLFLVGVLSILFFLALVIFGFIPIGEVFSNLVHYFNIHYKKIPLLVMVVLILAIIAAYIFTLVLSYLVLIALYSRGAWGSEAGEISLGNIFKRKKKQE